MRVSGVKQIYGGRCVLDVPDLELEHGRVYAVIGTNGSGKSTLARALAGTLAPTEGRVERKPGEKVGFMPQKSYAFYGSLRKNLLIGAKGARDKDRAEDLIERLGLTAVADGKAKRLSGGETARMALARVLMRDADLLVLDEPTAAFDIESTLRAERLLTEYCERTGAGMVVVTHSIKQAERLADDVLFFSSGRIVEQGPAACVLADPKMRELRDFLDIFGS